MKVGGFTLIELVMVIVLTGALFATTAIFIVGPTTAYADLARRAQLVDSADLALRRMARDIRSAVPNSVRVHSSGYAIEMLEATTGGRYRAAASSSSDNPDTVLEFDRFDNKFNVLGGFAGVTPPFSWSNHYLVVYNLGSTGSDVFEGSTAATPVITPATSIDIDASNQVTLGTPFRFAFESPQQRIFLSSGRVRYTCDLSNGRLLRLVGGDFVAPTPAYDTSVGDTVTDQVSFCQFEYTAGTASRSGVVTLRITLTDGDESIRLLRQVQVDNLP